MGNNAVSDFARRMTDGDEQKIIAKMYIWRRSPNPAAQPGCDIISQLPADVLLLVKSMCATQTLHRVYTWVPISRQSTLMEKKCSRIQRFFADHNKTVLWFHKPVVGHTGCG